MQTGRHRGIKVSLLKCLSLSAVVFVFDTDALFGLSRNSRNDAVLSVLGKSVQSESAPSVSKL